ncbi:hypothetical protein [Succinimonas sp.]|uniref:hypothetical protein n=1 Tax=Succinimonas sp. TaxID=1936151 RepID=UPI00386563A9
MIAYLSLFIRASLLPNARSNTVLYVLSPLNGLGNSRVQDTRTEDGGIRPEKCKEPAGRSPLKNPARQTKKSKLPPAEKTAKTNPECKRFQKLLIIITVTFLTTMIIIFKNLVSPSK